VGAVRAAIVVLSMLAAQAALPLGVAAQEQEALRRAEALLSAQCSRCHAIGRSGASPRADAPLFRTLSRKYPIESLGEALAQGLSVGHEDMPEFVFAPGDVGAILDYLRSIQER
jgi:mono/diheme cytochrome c family protein